MIKKIILGKKKKARNEPCLERESLLRLQVHAEPVKRRTAWRASRSSVTLQACLALVLWQGEEVTDKAGRELKVRDLNLRRNTRLVSNVQVEVVAKSHKRLLPILPTLQVLDIACVLVEESRIFRRDGFCVGRRELACDHRQSQDASLILVAHTLPDSLRDLNRGRYDLGDVICHSREYVCACHALDCDFIILICHFNLPFFPRPMAGAIH